MSYVSHDRNGSGTRILAIVLTLATITGGCQPVGPAARPVSTESLQEYAVGKFLDCVKQATHYIDDRVSDPLLVGKVIMMNACRCEVDGVVAVFTRGESMEVRETFQKKLYQETGPAMAADMVQFERFKHP